MKPNYALLSFVILLSVLVGIVGGGVMGGLAGYYAGQYASPVMRGGVPTAVVTAASDLLPGAPETASLILKEDSAVIDAVRKVKPAVVTVVNKMAPRRSFFGGTIAPTSSGSGIIIDPKGYIVTNNHVVEGAQKLQVTYADGSTAEAQVVGTDSLIDIAVIQVDGKVPAAAQFGDSNALEPGQVAIAIGSPLGDFRGTVTVGVVSAINRNVGRQYGLIQTDAAINNGNSGGPLVNALGQVIGINTLVVRSTSSGNVAEGLGFAIPSNLVREIVNQLIARGKVEHPYIGITYQDVNPQIASALNLSVTEGVLVMAVEPNTPAARAGLQEEDVILALNSTKINQENPLISELFKHRAGEKVTLTVMRGSRQMQIELTLAANPLSLAPGEASGV